MCVALLPRKCDQLTSLSGLPCRHRSFQEADVEVLLECDVEQAIQLPDIYMCVRKLCESIPLVEHL